jgi:hypothetical protein
LLDVGVVGFRIRTEVPVLVRVALDAVGVLLDVDGGAGTLDDHALVVRVGTMPTPPQWTADDDAEAHVAAATMRVGRAGHRQSRNAACCHQDQCSEHDAKARPAARPKG